jgi:hypothetical protein
MEERAPYLDNVLQKIQKALSGLRYGEVTIKVQDGKVRLIERKEQEKIG